jgi:hypothetical protein
MSDPKVLTGPKALVTQEKLECHLADYGLDEVRPVKAIQTICSKDTFLL